MVLVFSVEQLPVSIHPGFSRTVGQAASTGIPSKEHDVILICTPTFISLFSAAAGLPLQSFAHLWWDSP